MCPNLPKSRCDVVLNGKCYIFGNKEVNWHEAEICCKDWGGHLTSVHSDPENYVVNSIRKTERSTWIGLNDQVKEGTYVWVDGTPLDYKNYHKGERNNNKGLEHCLLLVSSGRLTWNDGTCNTKNNFICKKGKKVC